MYNVISEWLALANEVLVQSLRVLEKLCCQLSSESLVGEALS